MKLLSSAHGPSRCCPPLSPAVHLALRSPHSIVPLLPCFSAVSIHCRLILCRYASGVRSDRLLSLISRAMLVQMLVFVLVMSPGLCRIGQYVASSRIGPPLVARENCVSMPSPALSSWKDERLVPQRGPMMMNMPPHLSPFPPLTGLVCVTVPVPSNPLAILPIHFPCCSVSCASISTMTSMTFRLM